MRCLNADFPHPQLISIRGEEVILIFDQDEQGRIAVYMFDGSGLNEAQRVRTEFVANAAHELRTPLATILGYAETLYGEQNGLGVDQRVAVEAIFVTAHGCGTFLRIFFVLRAWRRVRI